MSVTGKLPLPPPRIRNFMNFGIYIYFFCLSIFLMMINLAPPPLLPTPLNSVNSERKFPKECKHSFSAFRIIKLYSIFYNLSYKIGGCGSGGNGKPRPSPFSTLLSFRPTSGTRSLQLAAQLHRDL